MLLDDYMRSYGIKKRNNCVHFDDCMPDELKKIYTEYGGVELPFGEIFDYNTMMKLSKEPPFVGEWLAFGKDKLFCFWVCKTNCTEGKIYTTWDHEMEKEIGEPVFDNIVDFFYECEEEWTDFDNLDSKYDVVLVKSGKGLSVLGRIKKDLNLNISSKDLLIRSKKLPCSLGTVSYETVKKSKESKYNYLKEYVKFNKI